MIDSTIEMDASNCINLSEKDFDQCVIVRSTGGFELDGNALVRLTAPIPSTHYHTSIITIGDMINQVSMPLYIFAAASYPIRDGLLTIGNMRAPIRRLMIKYTATIGFI